MYRRTHDYKPISVSVQLHMRSEGLYKDAQAAFHSFNVIVTNKAGRHHQVQQESEKVILGTYCIYLHLSPLITFFIVQRLLCFI